MKIKKNPCWQGRPKGEGGVGWMESVKDREERSAWARLQLHQEEQLVRQQDDCRRCLPTAAALAQKGVHLPLKAVCLKSLPG